MELENWKLALPQSFPEESRVWVYQNNRPFSTEEEQKLLSDLNIFTSEWMSHNKPVKGWATVLFHQFIIIMADDTGDRLCGSAVDGSLRFVKELGIRYGLQLLDRMQMGFLLDEKVCIIPLPEVEKAVAEKKVNGGTLFFNNAVVSKGELLCSWCIPLSDSYLWSRFTKEAPV